MREARVEADAILLATEKAQKNEAWQSLTREERGAIEKAKQDVQAVYNGSDYRLLNEKIEALNRATQSLAENMMNTAVRGARFVVKRQAEVDRVRIGPLDGPHITLGLCHDAFGAA